VVEFFDDEASHIKFQIPNSKFQTNSKTKIQNHNLMTTL
jgi:hypothetical protein